MIMENLEVITDSADCPQCWWMGQGTELKDGKCPRCEGEVNTYKVEVQPMPDGDTLCHVTIGRAINLVL
jgi:hypothetical protein